MPISLGKHNPRLKMLRALRTTKGRSDQHRFIFEGWTLLQEARASQFPVEALYATQVAFDNHPSLAQMETSDLSVYVVDDATFAGLSDVKSASGILAVARMQLLPVIDVLAKPGQVLLLADVNDPGNAGTLLRSAEAFGIEGAIFGTSGVQPYHPKVVRSAMGSLFRMRLAVAPPDAVQAAALSRGFAIVGTEAGGEPIDQAALPAETIFVIGQERRGLGKWAALCRRAVGIPMSGRIESLNAAVAGSIILYEASKRRATHAGEPVKTV